MTYSSGSHRTTASNDFFQTLRDKGSQILHQMLELTDEDEIQQRIQAANARLDQDRLKILIVGEFSRGKSTLINAFLGKPVLPSGVNPTTACINILKGGHPRQATFHFEDNTQETLPLPELKINKFLKDKVTAKNESVQTIREVHIQIPGHIEQLHADIVDTPGVNDLDAAREEVTFRYLREADAVVLILDAQQPLSESERIFLKDKVFGSDINRILFVVNKVDEVLIGGQEEDIPKIRNYVAERLEEFLGLKAPEIHMVASKPSLRARYKGEPDTSPVSFELFESALISFADKQATTDRANTHIQRIIRICEDHLSLLEVELKAAQSQLQDASKQVEQLEKDEVLLANRVKQLEKRLEIVSTNLGNRIASLTSQQVQQLRTSLLQNLEQVSSQPDDDALEEFRRQLSQHLRELVNRLEQQASDELKSQASHLEQEFGDLLARKQTALVRHQTSSYSMPESFSQPETNSPLQEDTESSSGKLQEFVTGASLGYLGASLFGPIGIGAAILGHMYLVRNRQKEEAKRLQEKVRQQLVNEVHQQCNLLAERASFVGETIASRESEKLLRLFLERTTIKQQQIQVERNSLRASLAHTQEQKQELARTIQNKQKLSKQLLAQVTQLENQWKQSLAN